MVDMKVIKMIGLGLVVISFIKIATIPITLVLLSFVAVVLALIYRFQNKILYIPGNST